MKKFALIVALSLLLALGLVAAVSAQAANVACAKDYTVLANDWMSKLADKYFGDVRFYWAIVDATNAAGGDYAKIADPDKIEIGWKLCIPSLADAQKLMAARGGGTVLAGPPTGAAPTAPAIPHSLEGRADCLTCHGPGGVRPVPADHTNRASTTCTGCHKPAPGPVSTGPVSTPAASAPAPVAGPGIPHSLDGFDNCVSCHGPNGVRPFPASHAGRGNDTCAACHSLAPGQVAGPVPGPQMAHSMDGRGDCLGCHTSGEKAIPANHAGRTNSMCIMCHAPGSGNPGD
jgi:mono/diheme cytochrome c family protein